MKRPSAGPTLLLSGVCVSILLVAPRFLTNSAVSPGPSSSTRRASFDTIATDLSAYQWPIEESLPTTSVFGDFRPTHFHGGIDISTRGQEGIPVRAMREGYVSRVRVSPSGYGKVVEVTHRDGFITWYAHLRGFADPLADLVRTEQQRTGRYSVDLRPDSTTVPIDRNGVIAFSGRTGVGGPHLHFELRDPDGNPLDPLLAPQFALLAADNVAPLFEEVGVLPLQAGTLIQGGPKPAYLRPVRLAARRFRLQQVIRVTGKAGFTVRVRDGVGRRGFRNRVTSLALTLDGAPITTTNVLRLPADESKQIALHYDWAARSAGHPFHQKLFIEEGNVLPFYGDQGPGSGMMSSESVAEGGHDLAIVARDGSGNESRLEATVVFNHPPEIALELANGLVVAKSKGRGAVTRLIADLPSSKAYASDRKIFEVKSLTSAQDGGGWILPVRKYAGLVVTAENAYGTRSAPVTIPSRLPEPVWLTFSTEVYRDFAIVTLRSPVPLTTSPVIRVSTLAGTREEQTRRQSSTAFFCSVSLNPKDGTGYLLQAFTQPGRAAGETRLMLFPVTPSAGGVVATSDSSFEATFEPGGVYSNLFASVKSRKGVVTLSPSDVLLDKGATVSMRVPKALMGRRVGLFLTNSGGRQLLAWRAPAGENILRSKVYRFLGEFSLDIDEVPPQIEPIVASYRDGILRLSCRMRDRISGIEASTIRASVDGTILIAEFDPERRLLFFNEPFELSTGRHEILVSVGDRMQNVAVRTVVLRVR